LAAAKERLEFLRSAVAEFKDGKLTCWTASQAMHLLCKQLAAMLAMPEGQYRADDDPTLTGGNSWPKSTAQR
jgi:CO/xanthine dehydrogenase Mo-binding subunit